MTLRMNYASDMCTHDSSAPIHRPVHLCPSDTRRQFLLNDTWWFCLRIRVCACVCVFKRARAGAFVVVFSLASWRTKCDKRGIKLPKYMCESVAESNKFAAVSTRNLTIICWQMTIAPYYNWYDLIICLWFFCSSPFISCRCVTLLLLFWFNGYLLATQSMLLEYDIKTIWSAYVDVMYASLSCSFTRNARNISIKLIGQSCNVE